MFNHIEIVITKDADVYCAKTPIFPKCIGKGESEAQAMERLSASIASVFSRSIKSSLKEAFLSNQYTEILFDSAGKKEEQKRIYGFRSGVPAPLNKQAWLRLKSLEVTPLAQESLAVLQENSTPQVPGNSLYGFPLSYN